MPFKAILSRSPILVPIENSYATSYNTNMPSYIVSKLLRIIGQIFDEVISR